MSETIQKSLIKNSYLNPIDQFFPNWRLFEDYRLLWAIEMFSLDRQSRGLREHVINLLQIINSSESYMMANFKLSEKEIDELKRAAVFHDIGKALYPKIFNKPGPFTKAEKLIQKQHTKIALQLIETIDDRELSLHSKMLVLFHQEAQGYGERRSGNNYMRDPDRRQSNVLNDPLFMKKLILFEIIDNVEAMITPRVYRPFSLSKEHIKEWVLDLFRERIPEDIKPRQLEEFIDFIDNISRK